MWIKWYTHRPGKGDTVRHCLKTANLPRKAALKRLKRLFQNGEGYTSVHQDTLDGLTPEECAEVEGTTT